MSEIIQKDNGVGYKSDTGRVCMIRCFKCGRENHAMMVASGLCAWCEHNANAEQAKGSSDES